MPETPTSAGPTTRPGATIIWRTVGGAPASSRTCSSICDETGTLSDGFQMTALPYASAGASFHAGMASGKFQGVIAAMTPTGTRRA